MTARRTALAAVFVGMAALGPQANALDPVRLTGEVIIAGRTLIDPPPDEPKNSHAYFSATGPAALQMYRSMRVKAEKDLCREGNMIKRAGPLSCSLARNGKSATCDFAVDLVKGALAHGQPC